MRGAHPQIEITSNLIRDALLIWFQYQLILHEQIVINKGSRVALLVARAK